MCIIVYKPYQKKMPDKKILKHCWDNNDDGAGYMFPNGKEVVIKKGFMSFDNFYSSLTNDYKKMGIFTPFVLHFRISTQAGVNEQCTHPFPLSRNMDDLKQTRCKSQIAIAHNGIIQLTKSSYNTTITYSDTMKFITDYASLLIKDKDFYKDEDITTLIDRLVGGRLAIMDYEGHTTLIGDFIEDSGIYYSNNTYKEDRVRRSKTTATTTTTTPSYYRSGCVYYRNNNNGKAPTEKKEENKKEKEDKLQKIVDEINSSVSKTIPPDVAELVKLPPTKKAKILDNWYAKKMRTQFEFEFTEDSCPKYYEGEDSYCMYCDSYDICKLRKRSLDDELEY